MKTFRVWDIEVARFRFDCFLACGGELWFNDSGRIGSLEQSKFIVQFATGLKDKNGVEIYEGDLVRLHEYAGEVYKEVLFRNGAFCVHGFNFNPRLSEVIGNVFANPELLKES